jgi:hypothetical protein
MSSSSRDMTGLERRKQRKRKKRFHFIGSETEILSEGKKTASSRMMRSGASLACEGYPYDPGVVGVEGSTVPESNLI